jgi:hypothetical protein
MQYKRRCDASHCIPKELRKGDAVKREEEEQDRLQRLNKN